MEENKNAENENLETNMFETTQDMQAGDVENNELENNSIFDTEENIEENSKEETEEIEQEEPKEELKEELENEEAQKKDNSLITVRPVRFPEFKDETTNRQIKKNLDILQDISMHISVEIGRTHSTIREVMDLEQGSIVELDKIAGEQVEVYANNKLVARGEVIVIEDKFGVRVTTTNIPKQSDSE